MKAYRRLSISLAVALVFGAATLAGVLADDNEIPIDPMSTETSSTTFGSYEVTSDGGSDNTVDTWDATEPFMTTHLTTEEPLASELHVTMDSTVSIEGGDAEISE